MKDKKDKYADICEKILESIFVIIGFLFLFFVIILVSYFYKLSQDGLNLLNEIIKKVYGL